MSDGPDLDAFLALPRLLNLHLSPDGARLALTVQSVAADGQQLRGRHLGGSRHRRWATPPAQP